MNKSLELEWNRTQPTLFPMLSDEPVIESKEIAASSSTFTGNMNLPIHRWFRYSAGFSARWVQTVIESFQSDVQICVFDPFAGSGTTLIAAQQSGVESWGTEAHPFVYRIAQAKLAWHSDPEAYRHKIEAIREAAVKSTPSIEGYPDLILKCYHESTLEGLDRLRRGLGTGVEMGASPSHRFWQILGEVLEKAVEPIMATQAQKHRPYLDKKGFRACRKGAKLSWLDSNGNTHDLDFVLERGGSAEVQGAPAAFIEVAWRRYTKHSRAKAQEIQGAIMPLLERHSKAAPFFGVVLAGVFTEPALQQLRSLGFAVLFIPAASIVKAFARAGIDAAADEDTLDSQFKKQVRLYDALSVEKKASIAASLLEDHSEEVTQFTNAMEKVLSRQIDRILILPLHGKVIEFSSIEEALASIEGFDQDASVSEFVRYEIEVRYHNGNKLHGTVKDKEAASEFLTMYKPIVLVPHR